MNFLMTIANFDTTSRSCWVQQKWNRKKIVESRRIQMKLLRSREGEGAIVLLAILNSFFESWFSCEKCDIIHESERTGRLPITVWESLRVGNFLTFHSWGFLQFLFHHCFSIETTTNTGHIASTSLQPFLFSNFFSLRDWNKFFFIATHRQSPQENNAIDEKKNFFNIEKKSKARRQRAGMSVNSDRMRTREKARLFSSRPLLLLVLHAVSHLTTMKFLQHVKSRWQKVWFLVTFLFYSFHVSRFKFCDISFDTWKWLTTKIFICSSFHYQRFRAQGQIHCDCKYFSFDDINDKAGKSKLFCFNWKINF